MPQQGDMWAAIPPCTQPSSWGIQGDLPITQSASMTLLTQGASHLTDGDSDSGGDTGRGSGTGEVLQEDPIALEQDVRVLGQQGSTSWGLVCHRVLQLPAIGCHLWAHLLSMAQGHLVPKLGGGDTERHRGVPGAAVSPCPQ